MHGLGLQLLLHQTGAAVEGEAVAYLGRRHVHQAGGAEDGLGGGINVNENDNENEDENLIQATKEFLTTTNDSFLETNLNNLNNFCHKLN